MAAAVERPASSLPPSTRLPVPVHAPRGRPPIDAVDDRALVTDLIGVAEARAVGAVPVAALLEAGERQLAGLGLGPVARRRLVAAAELARRFQPSPDRPQPYRSSRDLMPHLAGLRRSREEMLALLAFDARLGLVDGPRWVAGGALMHVAVAPREIYAPAVELRAAAIVIAHNHPSGVAIPSDEDVSFTRSISEAGAVLGIPLLDHLVVARREYFSFREAGLLGAGRPS